MLDTSSEDSGLELGSLVYQSSRKIPVYAIHTVMLAAIAPNASQF